MQIRYLFLTSLIISGSARASTSLQDQEAPSQEILEMAEKVRAQADLVRHEVDMVLEQVEAAQKDVEAKHLLLAPGATASKGQNPDRGYLGIEMTIEDGVMLVGSVMPGSGADKAGLKAGDRILSVNKIMIDQEGAEEKLAKLKAGKKVKVHFYRAGEVSTHIMRALVSLSSLSSINQGEVSRIQVNRLRRVAEAEGDHDGRPAQAIVKRLSEAGQGHVIELKLGGQDREDREGLPGNIREHIRALIGEHGGEGEHQIRVRMERDHDEDGEEHDVRVVHLGDGGGSWVVKGGDSAPKAQRRARVEVSSGEGDGRHMNREMGDDLKGFPEHIHELVRAHGGVSGEGAHGIFILDDENGDRHDNRDRHDDHDGHDNRDRHDDHDGHDDRDHHDDHDGHDARDHHDGHDGRETRGKAIIKMLIGDGERTMEFDFDGEDLREMGGRVRQLLGGRSFDLGDVLARVRGGRNDRSGSDSRGLHREEDHDDAGDHDPRGQRQGQDRGMNRPQAFGRSRGMGMTRGRGRGGPEMFREEDHEDYDDDDGEFEELEERIEELEQRIEELEELLERVRGRRQR